MGRTINWCGYTWQVRAQDGAPGPNKFSDATAQVSVVDGVLKLAITKDSAGWQCAEVHLEKALGYGRYRWRVNTRMDNLDPQAVLGLFTYDWYGGVGNGEVDIEVAKWGVQEDTDVEFSVQPVAVGKNKRVPISSAAPYECWFTWVSGRIDFAIRDAKSVTTRYTVTKDVMKPGDKTWPFINLWLNKGLPPLSGQPVKVEIANFRFEKV